MRMYNHNLQINLEIRSGLNDFWPTYSRWALKFKNKLPTTVCDQPHHNLRINIEPCSLEDICHQ